LKKKRRERWGRLRIPLQGVRSTPRKHSKNTQRGIKRGEMRVPLVRKGKRKRTGGMSGKLKRKRSLSKKRKKGKVLLHCQEDRN